jgi:CO/xanthine dehydrogenase Mo-binding subunit
MKSTTTPPLQAESVIGKSIPRVDGNVKVTGRAKYITDLHVPGMLHAKILFSDRPHARIVSLDVSAAQALDGVHAVITAQDAPKILYGLYLFDRYVFAIDRVRHIGEPIAAVAATSKKIAERAISLIKIEYEDLPVVLSMEAALEPGAPIIHPDLAHYQGIHPYIKYDNVCMDSYIGTGDIERGFAESDLIVSETYRTSPMHQASIEPHACLADFDHTGRITLWTGTQQLSVCHSELARSLGIPQTKIRIVPVFLGGGFGGKLKTLHEQICVLLAQASQAPVKLELTREEEFTATHPRAYFIIKVKTGVNKDGTLWARQVDVIEDVGAYTDHALGQVPHAMTYGPGPYHFPHISIRGRAVYTNNPDWGCMRGYGGLEIAWATEAHMDQIAHKLGMDPAELRLKNLVVEGETYVTTQPLRSVHIRETMETALRTSGYYTKKGNLPPNHGIGIANSMLNSGFLASSAFTRLNEDGTLSIITSVTDLGTGNHTALIQIAAESLGVPIETVSIAAQDSDVSPYDTGSIASRTVFDAGNAVRLATLDVRHQIVTWAANKLECAPEDIEISQGRIYDRGQPLVYTTIQEAAFEATFLNPSGPILGRGAVMINPPYAQPVGVGFPERPTGSFTFATHVVETEVDPSTGLVKILNYTACHDVGQVINQAGIEGQVEGGVVQGIGYGMFEELIVQDGKILNPSFVDYRLPTALDLPFKITSEFIEVPEERGPFGAKGVGEPVMIPPAPALANAIFDAIGVAVTQTPFTPERLWRAIQARQSNQIR